MASGYLVELWENPKLALVGTTADWVRCHDVTEPIALRAVVERSTFVDEGAGGDGTRV